MSNIMKKFTVTLTVLAIVMAAVPTFAAGRGPAPRIEDIEYEGRGRVQVDFRNDVKYGNTSVAVKDTKGNAYQAYIIEKDDDDIEFRIKNFKKGRTYQFTIKNVAARRGGSYRDVKGTVRIPAPQKKQFIGKEKAIQIALKDAGLKRSSVKWLHVEFDRDDGVPVYEVEFNRRALEYSYEIHARSGRILDKEVEYDD